MPIPLALLTAGCAVLDPDSVPARSLPVPVPRDRLNEPVPERRQFGVAVLGGTVAAAGGDVDPRARVRKRAAGLLAQAVEVGLDLAWSGKRRARENQGSR